MDLTEVAPQFDPELIAAMKAYLTAVDADDLDSLEPLYASDFANIRWDRRGFAANIRRETFLGFLRMWRRDGGHPEPAAEATRICATTRYGDEGAVLVLRTKAGRVGAYTFLWRREATGWRVVRELTFQDALPGVPDDAAPSAERL